jgi:membrane protein required for colicin V production
MNWFDIAILAVIFISSAISVLRGFTREALSLAAWILSFWVAITFAHRLDALLADLIHSETARISAAFAILFLLTLLAGSLVNYLIGQLVKKTGLSGTDRVLGILFGIGRGIVVVSIVILLAGLTSLPQESFWKESMLIEHFRAVAIWMRGFLPTDIASNFVF